MVGFDAKNKYILDPKFICPQCSMILRDPVQLTSCGHQQCQSCINTLQETTIKCPSCQTETQSTELLPDRGFKNDMQSLPIDCSFCQWTGVLNHYQEHLDQSHPNPQCEYCDKQCNSVDALNQHKVLECQKLTTNCLLKPHGCNEQIIRGKMDEHYLSQQHQEAILKIVRQMRSQSLDSQMDTNTSRTTAATASDSAAAQLQELYETLDVLTSGIEALNEDAQRLKNELLQSQTKFQTFMEDFSKVKIAVEESHSIFQRMKHNQDTLNQDFASLQANTNDMQPISHDGTLIWKITNVREKMTDAQSERQTSICSQPFYSSLNGYKMRARLYLHGDGNARRTHMSIFFVLMQGLDDLILKFPFNHKVAFCMYDQTPARRHIIDSFRPDITSDSFQRPCSPENRPFGIPKFFPLAMIQQEGNPYVRDDTMFIRVVVDVNDTAENISPYAFSLNPGLPTHIQEEMIKQEAERRAQQQP